MPDRTDGALAAALGGFLFDEAAMLDRWELTDWLSLFEVDAMYVVPTTDLQTPTVHRDMTLISDDLTRLRARVSQLLGGKAWAESPPSRTRRMITNVVGSKDGDMVSVTANFMVHRFRHDRWDTFIGRYDHDLLLRDGAFRFRNRRAILDHQTLTPQAMVSFIL